jgi:hypothetical protein
MKQAIESIQKPHAKFSLINTGSKPKYTVRTTLASVDGGGVQSAGQALSLRDNTTSSAILPMISRGFWLFLELESRYKDIRDCRNPEAKEGLCGSHPCSLDTGNPCHYDGI